jgi:hypothetical protein
MHKVFSNPYNFSEGLTRRGFATLGRGTYGKAMGKPGQDRIIKISVYRGDAWPHYIQWAVDNGFAGNCAPAVYSIHTTDNFTVAVIERLKSIYEFEDGKERYSQLKRGIYGGTIEGPWKVFFEKLDKFRAETGAGFDLHDGNFMMRANGEIVATDPVNSIESSKATTLRYRSTARLAA